MTMPTQIKIMTTVAREILMSRILRNLYFILFHFQNNEKKYRDTKNNGKGGSVAQEIYCLLKRIDKKRYDLFKIILGKGQVLRRHRLPNPKRTNDQINIKAVQQSQRSSHRSADRGVDFDHRLAQQQTKTQHCGKY